MIDLYKILKLKRDCTAEQIRKAYRVLSKKYHPDMPHGNAELFKQIKLAHDVLMDADRRKKYDETGGYDEKGASNIQATRETRITIAVIQNMQSLLFNILSVTENLDTLDFVATMKLNITNDLKKINAEHGRVTKNLKRQEKHLATMMKRLKYKNKSMSNIFTDALQNAINVTNQEIEKINEQLEVFNAMLNLMEDFSYDFDKEFDPWEYRSEQERELHIGFRELFKQIGM